MKPVMQVAIVGRSYEVTILTEFPVLAMRRVFILGSSYEVLTLLVNAQNKK